MDDDKKIVAKEKRANERLLRVTAGAAELRLWLKDLVRAGILSLQHKDHYYFEKIRARMVDAQATGLSNLVRDLRDLHYHKGNEWQDEAMHIIAKMYLLLEGFARFEQLDEATQADLRYLMGWSVNQKEILENGALDTVDDDWLLFGRIVETIEDITVQRNYIYGCKTGHFSLLIYFAFRNMNIENTLIPAQIHQLSLVNVPSSLPSRALVKSAGEIFEEYAFEVKPLEDWYGVQVVFSERLGIYPFLEETPFLVANLILLKENDSCYLVDKNGYRMKVMDGFDEIKVLQILAISGGKPLSMFILRKREYVLPFGIIGRKRYVIL